MTRRFNGFKISYTACIGRMVGNNYDTQGVGSLTRASIAELTPTQLQSLFAPSGLFADMDSWFRSSFEMKACGIKTNGMYEWIMSSMREMGNLMSVEHVDRGPSLLKPFVLGRQDSVINKDFWAITQGQAVSAYTAAVTGPLTSGDLYRQRRPIDRPGYPGREPLWPDALQSVVSVHRPD